MVSYLIELKIIGFVFITLASAIGCSLPLIANMFLKNTKISNFIQLCFMALGSGVVIATSILHLLPDGLESWNFAKNDSHENCSTDFNTGYFIVVFGVLFIFFLEAEIHRFITAGSSNDLAFKVHIIEASIAVHSVFVGIAYGSMSSVKLGNTLAVAIVFHQLYEGFSLGPFILRGSKGRAHTIFLILLFTLSTPLGIIIGVIVYIFSNPRSVIFHYVEGGFSLFAAGMLIFASCFEFLGTLIVDSPVLDGSNDTFNTSKIEKDFEGKKQNYKDSKIDFDKFQIVPKISQNDNSFNNEKQQNENQNLTVIEENDQFHFTNSFLVKVNNKEKVKKFKEDSDEITSKGEEDSIDFTYTHPTFSRISKYFFLLLGASIMGFIALYV